MSDTTQKDTPDETQRSRADLRILSEANVRLTTEHEWLLESLAEGGKDLRRTPIAPLPFRIGRMPGLELVLPSQLVSKNHAEIYEGIGGLRLRDLQSTNGSFVNRQPVDDVPLHEHDIVHFGDFEFRVARLERHPPQDDDDRSATASIGIHALPRGFMEGTRQMRELLEEGTVRMLFQPIVRLPGGRIDAYEALGRGTHPSLPESPFELFKIAAGIDKEPDLARL
ncbi:MAG TPA: FHA domain-containing protein, partial [Vicinamibacteria bacterium]|nr:FHA domain-containing protein [Vicinamibacteria bacterium]